MYRALLLVHSNMEYICEYSLKFCGFSGSFKILLNLFILCNCSTDSFIKFLKFNCLIFGFFGTVVSLATFFFIKFGKVMVSDGTMAVSKNAEIEILAKTLNEARSIAVRSVQSIIPGSNLSSTPKVS